MCCVDFFWQTGVWKQYQVFLLFHCRLRSLVSMLVFAFLIFKMIGANASYFWVLLHYYVLWALSSIIFLEKNYTSASCLHYKLYLARFKKVRTDAYGHYSASYGTPIQSEAWESSPTIMFRELNSSFNLGSFLKTRSIIFKTHKYTIWKIHVSVSSCKPYNK